MGSSLSSTSTSSVPSSIVSSTSSNNSISSTISNFYFGSKKSQNNKLYKTQNEPLCIKQPLTLERVRTSNIGLAPKEVLKKYSKSTYEIKHYNKNNKYDIYSSYYNDEQQQDEAFEEYNVSNNLYNSTTLSLINAIQKNKKSPLLQEYGQLKFDDNQLFEVMSRDSNAYIYDHDISTESSGIESGSSARSGDSEHSVTNKRNSAINSTLRKISAWGLTKRAAAISNAILNSVKDLNNNESSIFKSLDEQNGIRNSTNNLNKIKATKSIKKIAVEQCYSTINIDEKIWLTTNEPIKQQRSNNLINKNFIIDSNNNKLPVNITDANQISYPNVLDNNKMYKNIKSNSIDLNNDKKSTEKIDLWMNKTDLNNIKLNHQKNETNFEINNNFEQAINLNFVNDLNNSNQKRIINSNYKEKYNEKKKNLIKKAQSYNFFTTQYAKLIEKNKNKNDKNELATYSNRKAYLKIKSNSQHELAKTAISLPSTASSIIPLTENANINTENEQCSENCCPCCCKNNKFSIKEQLNKENKTKAFFKNQTRKQQRNSLLSIIPSSVSSNRLTSILSKDNKNLFQQNSKNTSFESADQRPFSWTGINFTQNSLKKNNKNKITSPISKSLFNILPSDIQKDNKNCLEKNKNFIILNNPNFEIQRLKQNNNKLKNFVLKSDIKISQSLNFNNKNVTENNDGTLIQASTSELLNGLGHFIKLKCKKIHYFDSKQVVLWMRTVDRVLMIQGWQDIAFINPSNLVFVYMLIRDRLKHNSLTTLEDLQSLVLTCLYISYSYMGNEISYPLKPFIAESTDRVQFWKNCVDIINAHSKDMLKLNSNFAYFLEVFTELKNYSLKDMSK